MPSTAASGVTLRKCEGKGLRVFQKKDSRVAGMSGSVWFGLVRSGPAEACPLLALHDEVVGETNGQRRGIEKPFVIAGQSPVRDRGGFPPVVRASGQRRRGDPMGVRGLSASEGDAGMAGLRPLQKAAQSRFVVVLLRGRPSKSADETASLHNGRGDRSPRGTEGHDRPHHPKHESAGGCRGGCASGSLRTAPERRLSG